MVLWWFVPLPHGKKVTGSNPGWGLSVWIFHVLPVYAWVLCDGLATCPGCTLPFAQ